MEVKLTVTAGFTSPQHTLRPTAVEEETQVIVEGTAAEIVAAIVEGTEAGGIVGVIVVEIAVVVVEGMEEEVAAVAAAEEEEATERLVVPLRVEQLRGE